MNAAQALRSRSTTSRDALWADVKRHEIALNGGRPDEAARIIRSARRGEPVHPFDALTDVVEAIYWGADSALAAGSVAQRLPATVVSRSEPLAPTDPTYLDLCSVGLWHLAQGDTTIVRTAIEQLRRVSTPYETFRSGFIPVCAAVLEATWAAQRDGVDYGSELERLDSLTRTGPPSTSWLLVAANLTVAELRERRGEYRQALAASRRRLVQYDLGEPRVLFGLSTYLRSEGRLAVLVGDTTAAIRAYRHYLTLRSDAEPAVRPEVEDVRASLAALMQRDTSTSSASH